MLGSRGSFSMWKVVDWTPLEVSLSYGAAKWREIRKGGRGVGIL